MDAYTVLKHTHLTCIGLSFSLFLLRVGLLTLRQQPLPKWLKIVPHCVDTLLLVSALALAIMIGYTPSNSPWLLAKIIALLFYIGFGSMAIRGRGTRQWVGFGLACLSFAYIVMAALTKSPWGIMGSWL